MTGRQSDDYECNPALAELRIRTTAVAKGRRSDDAVWAVMHACKPETCVAIQIWTIDAKILMDLFGD